MSDEKNTTEVIEIPIKETPIVPEKETMTREEMKMKGWSDKEIESASKREMVSTPEDKQKKEDTAAKLKSDQDAAADKAGAEKKAQEMADAARRGELPDFTMTAAQEKVFLDTFGPGTAPRAMYFRMKNERQSRQRAETERDRVKLELQMLKDEAERRTKGELEPELDANGNVIDPDDRPLTMRQIKELQKAEAERQEKSKKEFNERAAKVSEALLAQEEYAKSVYVDFEKTVTLAKDLVDNPAKVTDPLKRAKLVSLLRTLQNNAANADKFGVEDYTASMIAYELGQMHPDYGKPTDDKGNGNGDKKADPKGNGALTAEQLEQMKKNTQRRSSAALPGSGGGTRALAPEEIKVKDLLEMDASQRFKFKKDHPALYNKLMRG